MAAWPRWVRWSVTTLAAVVVLGALLVGGGLWAAHRSVPTLDGEVHVPGLSAPVAVARDALGTAVVRSENRLDAARALGFVHGQERFFEMDVTRRSAAGELSELVGQATLERDEGRRRHRLRARLAQRFATLPPDERALLQAYADGVNAGVAQLGATPWQYLLLRAEPRRWEPVDSLLVISEMFWMLQGGGLDAGLDRARLRERVGDARFDWLEPRGGRWDAPLDASTAAPLLLPGADLIDLRAANVPAQPASDASKVDASRTPDGATVVVDASDVASPHEPVIGSNNWAVAGTRSVDGRALLADDMHLGLSAPGIWFRAQLEIGQGAQAVRAQGVSLPGLPAIVAGSNGRVAWGFTNAYGQWFDWIELPSGSAPDARLKHVAETIKVKGATDVALDVAEWNGAPVIERDGHAYALRWIADDGDAYNLGLDALLGARGVDDAVAIAQRAGMPHQNILVADSTGRIAWTVAGRLWAGVRGDQFGRFAPPALAPAQWLAAADYPLVKDPPAGQLWTANARQLGGANGALIGDGGFDVGARAQRIRDRLSAITKADEASVRAIEFDNDAALMRVWGERVTAAVASSGSRADVAALLKGWNGRADADQAAYRLLRSVRVKTLDTLWLAWTTPLLGASQSDKKKRIDWHAMFEYPVEQALAQQPINLLPKPYASWNEFLLAQVDASAAEITDHGRRALAAVDWGDANASHIRHLMSRAVPPLSPWLDMPSLPQSGDNNVPHVSGANVGQSERLVVAPGHEDQATLVMPGGQSGHPMSPYYGAGQADWAAGRAEPLLAGPAQHVLTLLP